MSVQPGRRDSDFALVKTMENIDKHLQAIRLFLAGIAVLLVGVILAIVLTA